MVVLIEDTETSTIAVDTKSSSPPLNGTKQRHHNTNNDVPALAVFVVCGVRLCGRDPKVQRNDWRKS